MELLITPAGAIHGIYGEAVDLTCLGQVRLRRASHVEPDEGGCWWADLSPVGGPKLGPFPLRSQAMGAEMLWLTQHLAALAAHFSQTEES